MPFKSTYLLSLWWMLLSIFSSCLNDVLTKFLSEDISTSQVCFFRFLFGNLLLLPIIYYQKGINGLKTQRLFLHGIRGVLFAIGMGLYSYALTHIAMGLVTAIGFTNPIFVLILARIFLREKVSWPIWIATFAAFMGIILICRPAMVNGSLPVLACVGATAIFASLDIINKYYITGEPLLSMLFFPNLAASFTLFPTTYFFWCPLTITQLVLLGILGIGGNSVLYFLLKAFTLSNVSALAPFKYIEIVASIVCGYLFFKESFSFSTYLGAMIIVGSTCWVAYYQNDE